jgi:hypothetical protein
MCPKEKCLGPLILLVGTSIFGGYRAKLLFSWSLKKCPLANFAALPFHAQRSRLCAPNVRLKEPMRRCDPECRCGAPDGEGAISDPLRSRVTLEAEILVLPAARARKEDTNV